MRYSYLCTNSSLLATYAEYQAAAGHCVRVGEDDGDTLSQFRDLLFFVHVSFSFFFEILTVHP